VERETADMSMKVYQLLTTLVLFSMAERFCSILSSKGVLSTGQQGASLRSEEVESFPVFFFQLISIPWDKK
jgi:hypothetical protein